MIDEKKFMEFMSELEEAGAEHVRFDDLRKFVDEFPKIGGWILCSERLPDKGVMNPITNDYAEYLCTVCVDGFRTVRPIKFDKDGCWVNHGMNFDKYVTAWQPLPEEYHG